MADDHNTYCFFGGPNSSPTGNPYLIPSALLQSK